MARRLGFETVMPFTGVGTAEQQLLKTPLCYFLFAAVNDVATLKPAADAIRFCSSRKVRFSPLIYFSESPSLDAIRACANMGFDDVITLPFTHARVVDRLTRQLDTPFVYYETSGYFGPDRRGRLPADLGTAKRGMGGQHRRLEIVRSLLDGVNVLRDDVQVAV
jgi:hypothetical protein